MTTPAEVRKELKKRGLPYNIFKTHMCWYVVGGDSDAWKSTSLNTYTFNGRPATWWVDIIQDMHKTYKAQEGV
jgi:hypothetical protein